MASIALRLGRIEKTLRSMNAGLCRLCYGTPVAVLYLEIDSEPDGPGYHDTGVVILAADSVDRVTDDLCCRACGTDAIRLLLHTHRGIGTPPTGKPLANYERSTTNASAKG